MSSDSNGKSPPRLAPGGGAGGGSKSSNNNRRRKNNRARNKKSPQRNKGGGVQNPNRQHRGHQQGKRNKAHADMTVITQRVELWDIPARAPGEGHAHNNRDEHSNHRHFHVAPYHFAPDVSCWVPVVDDDSSREQSVAVLRAPRSTGEHTLQMDGNDTLRWSVCESQVVDNSIANPHPDVVHDKYWAQRRRLFSRFDQGIQLDAEGWFSVTPQVIAHHVASRVGELSNSTAFRRGLPGSDISNTQGIVVLDAFCGCGGNSIAFGKLSRELISLVVSVDVDREKLRMAAHNAAVYDIPKDKIIFVECSTMHIMEHCYRNGDRVKEACEPKAGRAQAEMEIHEGYPIGGLDLLPDRIDAVFMDPPWGGVDYNTLGKDGYDLEKHMKICVGSNIGVPEESEQDEQLQNDLHGGVGDDFFDTFSSGPPTQKKFTPKDEVADGWGSDFINGLDLLKLAARATKSRLVVYDLPRNANKESLGQAALAAGFRGNIKLEENSLNGRLKTVTAYMGADYSGLL